MPVFIFTIFLSAFLLFQVQPIIARYILPWYGGSPAVWTTCMLCFQVGLLAGYAYAHGLAVGFRNRPRWQAGIHLGLIFVSLLLLPITPAESLKPDAALNPSWGIVKLLFRTVGLPFLIISASGPLMQHWFASAFRGTSPYRLYAVSNFGSLLALVSYPFVIEPVFGLGLQTQLWSATYVIYGVLAVLCARQFLARFSGTEETLSADKNAAPPTVGNRILWGAFAALGSVLLLATTNRMCQDIAVVPFLWVLPLALYLTSFIVCFDHDRWYRRDVWIPLAVISVGALIYLLNQDFDGVELHVTLQIGIYVAAMFTCCMICHGEMVRLRPPPRFLTSFYLLVALGGALGGLLVSQVAPRTFPGYWELHAVLVAVAAMVTYRVGLDIFSATRLSRLWQGVIAAGWFSCLVAMFFFLWEHIDDETSGAVTTSRGFYGVLRVYEGDVYSRRHWRALYHGRINHGQEFVGPWSRPLQPSTYYMENSGPGVLFNHHPKRRSDSVAPMKIGVVGLGVGTLASYAKTGDTIRFYEIDPDVEVLARTHFSYLGDCLADLSIALGDARTSMENELANGTRQDFDVLLIDAFSGDSIPVHLFTVEAFNLYLDHLNPKGILAVHITNLHLDLSDPIRTLADELNLRAIWIDREGLESGEYDSSWVLLSPDPEVLDDIAAEGLDSTWALDEPRPIRWSDDYSNLFDVIIWD